MARPLLLLFAVGAACCGAMPAHANDVAYLDGRDDGRDRATGLRRAELALKGSGPGGLSWVLGYDVDAERFLDANLAYAFEGDGGARDPRSTHIFVIVAERGSLSRPTRSLF